MSDLDSTEEFSNESDNWESAEDISENNLQKSADSDSDLGEIESQFEPYTKEPPHLQIMICRAVKKATIQIV